MKVVEHYEIPERYEGPERDEARRAAGLPIKRHLFGAMVVVDELVAELLEDAHLARDAYVTDGVGRWPVLAIERHPTASGGVGLRAGLMLRPQLPAVGSALTVYLKKHNVEKARQRGFDNGRSQSCLTRPDVHHMPVGFFISLDVGNNAREQTDEETSEECRSLAEAYCDGFREGVSSLSSDEAARINKNRDDFLEEIRASSAEAEGR